MKVQNKAYIFAGCAVIIWSTVATAFKITLRYIDFIEMLILSSFVSLIALLIILIFQKNLFLIKESKIKNLGHSALLGFLNPFLYYLVLFKAYSLLPAQEAQPLNYIWGIMVVLLSIPILKQKINFKSFIALIISFLGVVLISTHGNIFELKFTNTLGIVLAISSSLIWACFWVFNLKDKRDEVLKLFLNFAFGTIYIFIYVLFIKGFKIPPINGLLGAIYIGLFEMGITFVLWLKAIKLSETTAQVSNMIYFSPFISLIFINFILGEKILLSSIIGLAFIVGGMLIQQYKKR